MDIPLSKFLTSKERRAHIKELELETGVALHMEDDEALNKIAASALFYGSSIDSQDDQIDLLRKRYADVFAAVDHFFLFERGIMASASIDNRGEV